jgi:hypothetical protein
LAAHHDHLVPLANEDLGQGSADVPQGSGDNNLHELLLDGEEQLPVLNPVEG